MRSTFTVLALLLVTAGAADGQDLSADPTYSDLELAGGFLPDPQVVELTAGGEIEVDVEGCDYGYVADAPDANFTFEGTDSTPLFIYVDSDEDTMLLVNGPDGTWYCDDDGLEDLNPLVAISSAGDGLYNIWVGTYDEEMVSATLMISELDPTE